jgi:hypothetical protein
VAARPMGLNFLMPTRQWKPYLHGAWAYGATAAVAVLGEESMRTVGVPGPDLL